MNLNQIFIYLSSKKAFNIWTKFGNSGHSGGHRTHNGCWEPRNCVETPHWRILTHHEWRMTITKDPNSHPTRLHWFSFHRFVIRSFFKNKALGFFFCSLSRMECLTFFCAIEYKISKNASSSLFWEGHQNLKKKYQLF